MKRAQTDEEATIRQAIFAGIIDCWPIKSAEELEEAIYRRITSKSFRWAWVRIIEEDTVE